ncbi:MAG TPA: aldehyde dehydrogenase family protein, partial [Terriglobales bacterium]|nr:aldehyde dehydrogenase family protein [Terriglobales bacterium]
MARGTQSGVELTGLFLDGKWITDRQALEVRSPYDQSVVGAAALATRADAEAAIAAAVRAFEVTRKLPAYERQRVLRKMAQVIAERREEMARTLAQEAGKPIKTARAEVDRAAFTFEVAAEEAVRIYGEYLPLDLQEFAQGRWGMVRRFPLGPIAAITPFNFPFNLVGHKVAPAIAAGCTVVLKPASQTPLSALNIAKIAEEAGWPAGALNVLPMHNEDASVLVRDDRLKLLTFTGSGEVGWRLKAEAGKKRVTLELGGNAGVIVHSDADLEYAAARCAVGGFSYAGQSCISVQRILVQKSVYDQFLAVFIPKVKALKTGDPLDEATDVGPLIRPADAERVGGWIKEATAAGAKLACGGNRTGSVLEPTVLTDTQKTMKVNCQEVFAPVVTVAPYDSFDEAVAEVNDSPYGLQAGVFTSDARLIFKAYEELEVGGVMAGEVPTFRIDHMPYGGAKDSGMGR